MPFICSICGEESTRICVRCTKDACNNHLCEKCLRCSDCCECEITLAETNHGIPAGSARSVLEAVAASKPDSDLGFAPAPKTDPGLPEPPDDPTPDTSR